MKMLFQQWVADVRGMKHYLIASTIVFVIGFILGATDRGLDSFLGDSIEGLGGIVEKIESSGHPKLYAFLFIFFNNAVKSILFVFMGAGLAVLPLFVLVVNGMILGFVMLHPNQTTSFWELLFKGILPHGIIELPAVILACAYGIRFGGLLLQGLFALPSEERRHRIGQHILYFLRMTLPLMLVLTGSLFVAAVIESTITFELMR